MSSVVKQEVLGSIQTLFLFFNIIHQQVSFMLIYMDSGLINGT